MDNNPEHDNQSKKPSQAKGQPAAPVVAKSGMKATKPTPTVGKWLSLIILGFIFAGLMGFGGGWLAVVTQTTGTPNSTDDSGATVVTTGETLVADVAKKVSPSVVSVVTSNGSRLYAQAGAGTGIVLSKDGYIMTNRHVIRGAKQVSIILADGTEYRNVKIVGADPLNDVAFLKVTSDDSFTPAELGNSSQVRIGQQVVAIGNALGQFQTTVTSGIVSALGRPLTAESRDGSSAEQLTDLLQTDAAINSGNSGGPLVDLSGRVIGMNTAIAADANGIGFAIPINATKGVIQGVLENGKVERALLGVRYINITPDVVAAENLSVKAGALVDAGNNAEAVQPGSSADKAGVKKGDIIQAVNGVKVGPSESLGSIIGGHRPGDTITLTVLRDDQTLRLKVTLAAYDANRSN